MLKWAKNELDKIPKDEDGIQDMINEQILDMVELFSEQGHSGMSANYVRNIISRLLDWKPLTPLTGEEDEWREPNEFPNGVISQQNKRCSAVFRDNYDNNTAHYIDGKIFSDDGGETWYSGKGSSVPVEFPYNVPDEPIKVITSERGELNYE